MITCSTIDDARARMDAARCAKLSVGFVPTMGYLHAGHMGLIERAKSENDFVVASIFVNPLQFGKHEDLSRYPRGLDRDVQMLAAAGVDLLFAPGVTDMYPSAMRTVVDVPSLGGKLEGEVRPTHFAGVATVVCKLLNVIQPTTAYFGEKDYQQVIIIKAMVRDLALPVAIKAVKTVRDIDGLALSSRNTYLSEAERNAAVVIPQALSMAKHLVAAGMNSATTLERELRLFLEQEKLAKPEVVAVRDALTLRRVASLDLPVVVCLIVRFGQTCLLDNCVIGDPTLAIEGAVQ
jgi:pantoate--beta-alanine ligase